jgi:serine/threonine-protein kinase RsbW
MPARMDRLDALHGALERFWSAVEDNQARPAHDLRLRFDLAVAELVGNVCEHAVAPHEVALRVDFVLRSGQVDAVLEDDADAAELPASEHDPDDLAESGRGLLIARKASDQLTYERTASGLNRWLLTCRLS